MSRLAAHALVFFTSAAVLVLEILAGRLLAPYLGVSIETFTAIIGVVLAGISIGAWAGGRAADRFEPRKLLGPLLVAGGILAMLAPAVVAIVGPANTGAVAIDAVFLTGLAFFLPAAVLTAVTPVVIKIRLASLADTGKVVGGISAAGTGGALFGTFITGFVLVAALPSRPIALATGGAIAAVGIGFLFVRGDRSNATVVAVLTPLALAAAFVLARSPCDWETPYVCARIEVDPDRSTGRILWSNVVRSSYVDVADPEHLEFRYTRNMAGLIDAQYETGRSLDVLFIGGGGYTLPQYIAATRPGSENVVLEIDATIVDIVRDEFGIEVDGPTTSTFVGDARTLLRDQPDDRFDVVVGDAFSGLTVPWHLTTVEFLDDIARVLRPGGAYIVNVIDYPPLAFARAQAETMREVFDHVAVVATDGILSKESGGNLILMGTDSPAQPDAMRAAVRSLDASSDVIVGARASRFVADATVLTDDFAPVDQLRIRQQ